MLQLLLFCALMQIKTLHELAVTYNDQSPLENHHHAAATRLLLQPEYRYLPVRPHLPITKACSYLHFAVLLRCCFQAVSVLLYCAP